MKVELDQAEEKLRLEVFGQDKSSWIYNISVTRLLPLSALTFDHMHFDTEWQHDRFEYSTTVSFFRCTTMVNVQHPTTEEAGQKQPAKVQLFMTRDNSREECDAESIRFEVGENLVEVCGAASLVATHWHLLSKCGGVVCRWW